MRGLIDTAEREGQGVVGWRAFGEVMLVLGGFVLLGLLVGLSLWGNP